MSYYQAIPPGLRAYLLKVPFEKREEAMDELISELKAIGPNDSNGRKPTDADNLDACLAVLLDHRVEVLELFDAVQATKAEVEDHQHRLAAVVRQRNLAAACRWQGPVFRQPRLPTERPQRRQCRTLPNVIRMLAWSAPILGIAE